MSPARHSVVGPRDVAPPSPTRRRTREVNDRRSEYRPPPHTPPRVFFTVRTTPPSPHQTVRRPDSLRYHCSWCNAPPRGDPRLRLALAAFTALAAFAARQHLSLPTAAPTNTLPTASRAPSSALLGCEHSRTRRSWPASTPPARPSLTDHPRPCSADASTRGRRDLAPPARATARAPSTPSAPSIRGSLDGRCRSR